jgi:hypothetical protein
MLGRRDRSPKRCGIWLKLWLVARLALFGSGGILSSAALAQTAATSPVVANDAPPMRVIPDTRFDPVASVKVSGPSGGMQVMRERGRRSEPVVVVTPNRSTPVAGAPVDHQRPATRAVMVAGSSVPPLRYRPDPVSEPKVTITPSGH